jgi:hypothetical protein
MNGRADINVTVDVDFRSVRLTGLSTGSQRSNSPNQQASSKRSIFNKIKREIDAGRAVILGGQFTRASHYIVVRGYEGTSYQNATLIVNDPYGTWLGGGQSGSNRYRYNVTEEGDNKSYRLRDIFNSRAYYPTLITITPNH